MTNAGHSRETSGMQLHRLVPRRRHARDRNISAARWPITIVRSVRRQHGLCSWLGRLLAHRFLIELQNGLTGAIGQPIVRIVMQNFEGTRAASGIVKIVFVDFANGE